MSTIRGATEFMNATIEGSLATFANERPLRVREAAIFLGVSPQTVYLWVERKQIPHLRVMGRNIRFLKSELEPFRAQFKQEIGNGKTE
jgi:excisionase family DNA binding protein